MSTAEAIAELVPVGATSSPRVLRVERGAAIRLLDATGVPVRDDDVVPEVPTTFPTTLQLPAPGLEAVDPARVLHGGQEYIYERPLEVGDELTCVARVAEVSTKSTRLGEVTVVTVETQGHTNKGELVMTERMTLIVR